jgi:hypothetical protein
LADVDVPDPLVVEGLGMLTGPHRDAEDRVETDAAQAAGGAHPRPLAHMAGDVHDLLGS